MFYGKNVKNWEDRCHNKKQIIFTPILKNKDYGCHLSTRPDREWQAETSVLEMPYTRNSAIILGLLVLRILTDL